MNHITEKQLSKILEIATNVIKFNERHLDARMTFKIHQDRVELIIYRGSANGGLLYDANFTTVGRENFESDLCKIKDVVNDMYDKFLGKKGEL